MPSADQLAGHLLMALAVFLLATASPGSSTLAIVASAIERGRANALATAAGALSASLLWGIAVAFGVLSLLRSSAWSPVFMAVFRGNYLLMLSFSAARSALGAVPLPGASIDARESLRHAFMKGMAAHASSPNAFLIWVCAVGLALPRSARHVDALRIVFAFGAVGVAVFGAYALAFSTAPARSVYRRAHRWFNAVLSIAFAGAGVHLLLSGAHASSGLLALGAR